MTKTKPKNYVVKSMPIANFLIENGFAIKLIDRDKHNRQYLVFIFDYSDGLVETIKQYKPKY